MSELTAKIDEIKEKEEISDSESEEYEPETIKQKPLVSRNMISLQNKKSIIKVHKPVEQINYFCD